MGEDNRDGDRGRQAEAPSEIPAKGWRDIALRVKRETSKDNVSIIAGGVAYYGFLAIFPALAALVLVYGLFADPSTVERELASLSGVPSGVRDVLAQQLASLTRQSNGSLGFGVVVSVVVALWSANKASAALITSLNIAYEEQEHRGFFHRTGITLLFTIGAVVAAAFALVLVAAVPVAVPRLGLPGIITIAIVWARWPVLAAAVLCALAVVYRYGPSRERPGWRWVTWGSAIATAVWLAASAGFSFYVSHFGSYNKTYGSVAAIAILLT